MRGAAVSKYVSICGFRQGAIIPVFVRENLPMPHDRLPDFVIIGATKAATT
jgi:hypothetical protein